MIPTLLAGTSPAATIKPAHINVAATIVASRCHMLGHAPFPI
ncbi:MAG: hypothetical protein AAB296_07830 [Candidatus Desantisbacteria bacterium]